MHFTIQVYDCGGCPYADHEREFCLDILSRDGLLSSLEMQAREVYGENVHGVCASCPRA